MTALVTFHRGILQHNLSSTEESLLRFLCGVYSLPLAETFSEVPILDLIEITVSGFVTA